jgi:hypothetical protein
LCPVACSLTGFSCKSGSVQRHCLQSEQCSYITLALPPGLLPRLICCTCSMVLQMAHCDQPYLVCHRWHSPVVAGRVCQMQIPAIGVCRMLPNNVNQTQSRTQSLVRSSARRWLQQSVVDHRSPEPAQTPFRAPPRGEKPSNLLVGVDSGPGT